MNAKINLSKSTVSAVAAPENAGQVATIDFSKDGSTIYACVWAGGESFRSAGSGKAGGCGYHLKSGAASEAISAAGISLSKDIHGAGSRSIETAVLAIATALGYPDAMLVVSHP